MVSPLSNLRRRWVGVSYNILSVYILDTIPRQSRSMGTSTAWRVSPYDYTTDCFLYRLAYAITSHRISTIRPPQTTALGFHGAHRHKVQCSPHNPNKHQSHESRRHKTIHLQTIYKPKHYTRTGCNTYNGSQICSQLPRVHQAIRHLRPRATSRRCNQHPQQLTAMSYKYKITIRNTSGIAHTIYGRTSEQAWEIYHNTAKYSGEVSTYKHNGTTYEPFNF